MDRSVINDTLQQPPTYTSRKKDKYSVPRLDKYMYGYTKILKMDIPSKTKENSFHIMNRQTWTNKKQWLSKRNQNINNSTEDSKCKLPYVVI